MAHAGAVYSVDTSALIHGWSRAYPPSIFPQVWDRIDGLIGSGALRASIEVYNDVEKRDDELFEWCKDRKAAFFVEIDEAIQGHIARLMGAYPRLVDTRKGLSKSDPFVIGLAPCHNPVLTVVGQERGGTTNKPKMDSVCQAEGVRCINLLELIREQGWVFG